jgi:undecaprenyl-diphosphatase
MDTALFFHLYGGGRGATLWAMIVLTMMGSGWNMIGLAPLLAMRRTRAFTWPLLAALAVTAVVVFALKAVVGRARPCNALAGVHAIFFQAPTDGSFPSGHAAGSACVAAFLIVRIWRSRLSRPIRFASSVALAVVAAGIAVSRVYLGVHYPLDVGAGAALGSLLGTAFALRLGAGSIQTAPRP